MEKIWGGGGILYLWSLIVHKQQELVSSHHVPLRIVTSHEMAYGTSIFRKSCKNQLNLAFVKIASHKKETTKCTLLHRGIVL